MTQTKTNNASSSASPAKSAEQLFRRTATLQRRPAVRYSTRYSAANVCRDVAVFAGRSCCATRRPAIADRRALLANRRDPASSHRDSDRQQDARDVGRGHVHVLHWPHSRRLCASLARAVAISRVQKIGPPPRRTRKTTHSLFRFGASPPALAARVSAFLPASLLGVPARQRAREHVRTGAFSPARFAFRESRPGLYLTGIDCRGLVLLLDALCGPLCTRRSARAPSDRLRTLNQASLVRSARRGYRFRVPQCRAIKRGRVACGYRGRCRAGSAIHLQFFQPFRAFRRRRTPPGGRRHQGPASSRPPLSPPILSGMKRSKLYGRSWSPIRAASSAPATVAT